MNGDTIEDVTILDEAQGGEIQYQDLPARLRFYEGSDEICKEASAVLREVRDLLLSKGIDHHGHVAATLGYDLLTNLSVKHTHQLGPKEFVDLDLIDMLDGRAADTQLQRGYLTAANYLEEAVLVLDAFRPDDRAQDLLQRITDRRRVSRVGSNEQMHQLHCDGTRYGHPCWMVGPSAPIGDWSERLARQAGWLVTEEKDLCPECWREADPEAAAMGGGPPTFDVMPAPQMFMPPPEMSGLDLDRELSLAEAATGLPQLVSLQELAGALQLLQSVCAQSESTSLAADRLFEFFGREAIVTLLAQLPPLDEVFEAVKSIEPPLTLDEPALRALIEELHRMTSPIPPA